MPKDFTIRALLLLRSSRVRQTLAELFARLSAASIIGMAWLFYAGGPQARAAIPTLLVVSHIFFFAAVSAAKED